MKPNTNRATLESGAVLLRRVIRILRACGLSNAKLRGLFEMALDDRKTLPTPNPSSATARQSFKCSDLVLRWRRDSRFLNSAGAPRALSIASGSPNFVQLAQIAAPNEDPLDLLEAMKELGVVKPAGANRVKLIADSVVACSGRDGSPVAYEAVLEHVCGFLGSVEYNVFDKPSRAGGRFERACYASVPAKLVPILERLVSARGQDFVDAIDEWLSRRTAENLGGEPAVLVGAGAYVFIRDHGIQ